MRDTKPRTMLPVFLVHDDVPFSSSMARPMPVSSAAIVSAA